MYSLEYVDQKMVGLASLTGWLHLLISDAAMTDVTSRVCMSSSGFGIAIYIDYVKMSVLEQ